MTPVRLLALALLCLTAGACRSASQGEGGGRPVPPPVFFPADATLGDAVRQWNASVETPCEWSQKAGARFGESLGLLSPLQVPSERVPAVVSALFASHDLLLVTAPDNDGLRLVASEEFPGGAGVPAAEVETLEASPEVSALVVAADFELSDSLGNVVRTLAGFWALEFRHAGFGQAYQVSGRRDRVMGLRQTLAALED